MTSPVRLATRSDEPEILKLLHLMHAESGMRALDEDCARETFSKAWDRKGGIIGVIGEPGSICATICLLITRFWYTRENHIEDMFCFVHPDHRQGKAHYAETLVQFAKKCADEIGLPLVIGVLTNERTAGKVRLYRRVLGYPAGAVFVHGAQWGSTAEDFWQAPFRETRGGRRRRSGNGEARA